MLSDMEDMEALQRELEVANEKLRAADLAFVALEKVIALKNAKERCGELGWQVSRCVHPHEERERCSVCGAFHDAAGELLVAERALDAFMRTLG